MQQYLLKNSQEEQLSVEMNEIPMHNFILRGNGRPGYRIFENQYRVVCKRKT